MDTLKWEHGEIFTKDLIAFSPDKLLCYYVGYDMYINKYAAIGMNGRRIGNYDMESAAMEACETHFANNGGW